MKKLMNLKNSTIIASVLLMVMVVFYACKKENFKQTTDDSVNITGYFDADQSNYSIFSKALVLTGNASYLNAYGNYTVFGPTDEAFKTYLSEQGKTSIEQVDLNELKDLVRLHLIEDTISTTAFTDGKISKATALGQFLTTSARNESGVTRIVVNKIARIIKANIRVGNGIIHSIDHVLLKSQRTLAQEIAATPSLSIFNEALVATGWNTKLNAPVTTDPTGATSYVSVLAITNEALKASGINSFADLRAKYSNTGNPSSLTDSLNLYVAYRVLPGLKYVADIVTATSHVTRAPLEIISVKLVKDTVLLNEEVFNGVLEKGVALDRSVSDVTTTNGVLHYVKSDFFIKKRVPTAVYWDVADQPEIRQLPSIFRVAGRSQSFLQGTLKDITWGGAATTSITYRCETTGSFNLAYWSDRLDILLRTAVIPWVEFKTPVIIRGRYKVWISFRSIASRSNTCEALVDGVPLSRTVNFADFRATNITETELEAQGFKRPISGNNNNWNARLLGTIDIQTTDRHIFRLNSLTNQMTSQNIDMIHFIPVDQDQLYPRFGPNGEIVNR